MNTTTNNEIKTYTYTDKVTGRAYGTQKRADGRMRQWMVNEEGKTEYGRWMSAPRERHSIPYACKPY